MVECKKCRRGYSLKSDEIGSIRENPGKLFEEIKCACDNKYSYLDGIVQTFVSEDEYHQWNFVSDIYLDGVEDIIVGMAKRVDLEKRVPTINKIYITPEKGFAYLEGIQADDRSFLIMSSALKKGNPMGTCLKVDWLLYGSSEGSRIPAWRYLLVEAKEEFIRNRYDLSLFSSYSAFESFINSILYELTEKKRIPGEASEFMVKPVCFDDKVYELLLSVGGSDFEKLSESGRWSDIRKARNKVVLGRHYKVTRADALRAFEMTLKAIIFLLLKV
jgi:hypothetical protein